MNAVSLLARIPFLSPRRRLEFYPPFWFMGVKVLALSDDWRRVRLRLPLGFMARNAAGNMFGGFQASLADPIPALACARRFPGYRVVTRRLSLDFRRPGSTDLELRFDFDPAQEELIREELAARGRSTPTFELAYYRRDGTLCTLVRNQVAIRARDERPEPRRQSP